MKNDFHKFSSVLIGFIRVICGELFHNIESESGLVNGRNLSHQFYPPIFIQENLGCAAGHVDGDGAGAVPQTHGRARRRTAGRTRSQGVARTPLPNLNLDGVPVYDFDKLDVGAVGELGSGFDEGAEGVDLF